MTPTEGPSSGAVLAALARGVLGSGYVPEVPLRMLDQLRQFPTASERRQLLGVLRALDTKAGALALTGRTVPVSWLPPSEAEALLKRWQNSRVGANRKLFLAFSSMALAALYGYPGPEWERMGYPGPMGVAPQSEPTLTPLELTRDEIVKCDVVIVGSGAGGGCAAAILAEAGLDVVVVEKGGYVSEADFDHLEYSAAKSMYLYGMNLVTADLGVRILAGSTLGGGTVVNYSTSFKTPPFILEEWHRVSGIDAFTNGEIEESLDHVAERLSVGTEESSPGKRDELIEDGLKQLGWHVEALPRAVKGCSQDAACGFCGFGCRTGAKQSSMRTYLEDAARHGARIITGADVRKVRVSNGKATGIEATANGHRLIVNARAVVAAAGAIETPALLLRSGLRGQVGRNLRLHPGTAAWGVFDDDVRMWEGTLQARYSAEFRDADGHHGPIFETVPVHPGTGAAAVPWTSAREHRELMGRFGNLSLCAVLPRDEGSGRITVDRDGQPKITYSLSSGDERRIADCTVAAGKLLEAAGAREIYTMQRPSIAYSPSSNGAHDGWAEKVKTHGFKTGKMTFFSYHQMGSARMGVDPTNSAIDHSNQSHEVKELYVMDGSAFPTASGVNPMLSIYGIAHRAATRLVEHLS